MSNQSDLAKSAAGFNGDPLSIDTANNRVGIGTSSPDAKLDVSRTGNGQIAVLQTSANRGFSFESQSDTALQIASVQGSTNLDLWANTLTFSAGASERMRIDASGRVTMPYQPAFRAYRNTDPGTSTSHVNMSWTNTEFNVGNHFANNKFTAPVSGTYLFGVNNNMGSGHDVSSWRLYKNGSAYHVISYNDFTASWKNTSGSTLMQLQANDYVEAWWRGDADYDIFWCGFFGYLIG